MKRKFDQASKTLEILCSWFSKKCPLLLMSLLLAQIVKTIVKTNHIFVGIYFYLSKKKPKQNSKDLLFQI